ncbi:MAG: PspC domain-containing protein [Oligoflexus sp.]
MGSTIIFERDTDQAWIAGVCAGFAGHFNLPVIAIRILFLILLVMSGFFPAIIAYVVLAFVVPAHHGHKTLVADHRRSGDEDFLTKHAVDPVIIDKRLQVLSDRVERLESYLISDAYQVDREFHKLRG